jgi:glycosyltransferase involved in cell wall biosynthesis
VSRLRVGIDVSPLRQTGAGTARHIRGLLDGLARENVDLRRFSFGGRARWLVPVTDVGWYLAALPTLARRSGVEVLHCPSFRAPTRPPVPLVVTFHDLAVLRHSETFNGWTRRYSEVVLPHVARAAARIIAVSEFTQRELVELLRVPERKIRVIPNGVGPPFAVEGPAAEGDYVLAVSTLEPRKNLARLVEGFRRASLDGWELRVVGASGWGDVHVGGERVRWLGRVGDGELARLYRGARCVAYPSLYEGFGLPVLEAMACGAPVVASRIDAAIEVGDGAVVLVDGEDPNALAAGLVEAIERRDELGRLGPARAARFDWSEAAKATVDVYREVAG